MAYRVVFFGSPDFAVPCLRALADDSRFDVVAVVTQPDRPSGRGSRLTATAVKAAAEALGLPVRQPSTLRSAEAVEWLTGQDAEVFVVVAYGEILQRSVLAIPRYGCLNVHPSLLPRYRGSSPIPAAILNGDAETGVTIIRMVRKLDAGPIIAQRSLLLDGTETAATLSERLAALAAVLLPATLVDWISGRLVEQPQDDDRATYTRELRKDDGWIDWRRPAVDIERLVRAMYPWPIAWTVFAGRRLGVLAVRLADQGAGLEPGRIAWQAGGVVVGTGHGALELVTVRPAGGQAMPAADWLRGQREANPQFAIERAENS